MTLPTLPLWAAVLVVVAAFGMCISLAVWMVVRACRCHHRWQHWRARGQITKVYNLPGLSDVTQSGVIQLSSCIKCGEQTAHFHTVDRSIPVSAEYAAMLARERKNDWEVTIEEEKKQ